MLKSANKLFGRETPASWLLQRGLRPLDTLRRFHDRRSTLALVDQLMVGGMNFLTILLLGRLAGPDDLGAFALVMTVFYLLLAVQESLITMPYTIFSVRLTGIRHRQYSAAALGQTAAWSACVSVILAITAIFMFHAGDHVSLSHAFAAFAMVAPLWLLREFGRRFLFAQMQVFKVLVMTMVGTFTQLVAISALAWSGRLSATTAIEAMGIACGVSGFVWLWFSRALFEFHHLRSSYFLRKHWVFGRWVLASQGTNVLAGNTMPWLVWIWLGPTATGLFAACDAVLRFANPIIVSLSNLLTPHAAHGLHNGGKAELNRIVWRVTAVLTVFLSGFCIALAVSGEFLLHRTFGETYAGYWAALILLGVNQLVAKFALAPSRALLLLERADTILLAETLGFAAALLAASLMIPAYDSVGAALALLTGSLATTAVTVGAYIAMMREWKAATILPIGSAMPAAAPAGNASE